MEKEWGFNVEIIHKVNYITIVLISLLMSLTTMSMTNFKLNIYDLLPFIITIVISITIYFSNINNVIKAMVFSLSIIVSNFIYLLFSNFNEQTNASDMLIFCAGIVCGSLYFNKKVMAVDAIILDICIIVLFHFNPVSVLGENFSYSNMLNLFFILNGTMILIYCSTIFGGKLIKVINKKSLENQELLDKLKTISSGMENITNNIEKSVEKS